MQKDYVLCLLGCEKAYKSLIKMMPDGIIFTGNLAKGVICKK